MRARTHGISQSVHTHLVRHARSLGVETELVLTRFAVERLLYRLSRSSHAGRFVLKGALLKGWKVFGASASPWPSLVRGSCRKLTPNRKVCRAAIKSFRDAGRTQWSCEQEKDCIRP